MDAKLNANLDLDYTTDGDEAVDTNPVTVAQMDMQTIILARAGEMFWAPLLGVHIRGELSQTDFAGLPQKIRLHLQADGFKVNTVDVEIDDNGNLKVKPDAKR